MGMEGYAGLQTIAYGYGKLCWTANKYMSKIGLHGNGYKEYMMTISEYDMQATGMNKTRDINDPYSLSPVKVHF